MGKGAAFYRSLLGLAVGVSAEKAGRQACGPVEHFSQTFPECWFPSDDLDDQMSVFAKHEPSRDLAERRCGGAVTTEARRGSCSATVCTNTEFEIRGPHTRGP